MSSRTGISGRDAAPEARLGGRPHAPVLQRLRGFTNAVPWLLSALVLVALVTIVIFDTRDSRGMWRDRSAPQVWTFVAPKLAAINAGIPLTAIYGGALLLTLAGGFALIRATGVRPRAADDRTPETPSFDGINGWRVCSRALRLAGAPTASSVINERTCVMAMAVIAIVVAWRLGAFVLSSPDTGLPDGFASIDHPFHVARAELLRRSLADGEVLRWVASHQGGYPAEFYPFGFAYGVVALWGLLLGSMPIPVVHKLAVIALFLAPALVYPALARRDGWPPLVGLSSFILHVSLPGGFWHGGYSELVFMGLVANVSAAVAVVISLPWLLDALSGRSRRAFAWAAMAAAAAIWCNPRSAIGLAACALGAWIAVAACDRTWPGIRATSLRLAAVGALAALLAAPQLASLLRFKDLYYFLHYTSYATTAEYLGAMIEAVSLPVFPLFVAGVLTAFFVPAHRVATRAVAFSVLLYIGLTLVFTFGGSVSRMVQQLETTRLMSVQRYLMIYLAAVGLHAVAVIIATYMRRVPLRAEWLQLGFAAAVLLASLTPSALVPAHVSPPSQLSRSGTPEMQDFEDAVRAAAAMSPGTAILVVGTAVSAHQQLWAPVVSDGPFFYDSWMWYWHRRHVGPYDVREAWEYDQERMDEVFSREYFRANGIGAVVTTGKIDALAAATPELRPIWLGETSTAHFVVDPSPIVTVGERKPETVTLTNHRIEVRDGNASGDLVVRQNWFPRWRAEVNGQPTAVDQTADGYMRIALPDGPVDVVVSYSLQPQDIAARGAGILGLVLAGALLARRAKRVSPSSETV